MGEGIDNMFGSSISSSGDINSDGINDLIIGSKYILYKKGRTYIYHGNSSLDNIADTKFFGENTSNYFGYTVENIGDFNGDGYDDFISGAYGFKNKTGKVYIYFGGEFPNTVADWNFSGSSINEYTGFNVAAIDDINNDGFDDVMVGAYGKNTNSGIAYVFLGSSNPDNTPDLTLLPETQTENFAKAISGAGDFNADGFSDFMIGAENYNSSGLYGRVYVYYGSSTQTLNATPDLIIADANAQDKFGCSVSKAGDFNGDGFDDIIIGRKSSAYKGTVFLYKGGLNPDNVNDGYFAGDLTNDKFAEVISNLGDINNDGFDDIEVSANEYFNDGKIYIYFGGSTFNNVADITVQGPAQYANYGKFVNSLGDINDDHISDFGIFSPQYNGKIYIWYGKSNISANHDFTLTGTIVGGDFGISFCNSGNFYGTASSDVIVGAEFASSNGQIYLYKGTLIPPVISNHSNDTTLCQGANINFFVNATATGQLNYQWKISIDNGISFLDINNQITSNLNLENVQTSLNGNIYKCVLSCEGGTIETDQIHLFVDEYIQANAGNNNEFCGNSTSLSANNPSAGTGYWTIITGNAVLSNSNSNICEITEIQYGTNVFKWNITNGTCLSYDDVTITAYEFISATAGNNESVCDLSEYQLNGNNPTSGTGTWTSNIQTVNFDNVNLFNATASNFTNQNVIFTWTIINGLCEDESMIEITFNNSVEIQNQPNDLNLSLNQTAIFEVEAIGEINSFQWKKNGANVYNGVNISGANTSTLTINNCTPADNGNYLLFIDGICNDISSESASLTVSPIIINIENIISEIAIFPNPVKNIVTFDFSKTGISDLTGTVIIISDISGKIVEIIYPANKIVNLDLNNYKKGIYVVKTNVGNNTYINKIIKE